MNTAKETLSFEKKSILKKGAHFLKNLTRPKSTDDHLKKREFIFNVLVLASLLLSGFFSLSVITELFNNDYQGIDFKTEFGIFLFFLVLYSISRRGYFVVASYILIAFYVVATTYTLYRWGADVPIGLLSYALIIIMTTILIGTRASIIITTKLILVLFVLTYLQSTSQIKIASYWKQYPVMFDDAFDTSVILGVIAILSCLYNHEIKKSLLRAQRSETALKAEKENLERKVKERTEELHNAQFEKVRQLYRFAEFGRLSSGLFHDLNNYLMALSLNLEKAKEHQTEDSLGKVKQYLNQAVDTSSKMEDFIEAIQKQLKKQEEKVRFPIAKEINQVLRLFHFRSKKEQIEIFSKCNDNYYLLGNPIRFNQAITNIISNAFDSYLTLSPDCKSRKIEIGVWEENKFLVILIRDWGCGISEENLTKIFKPFFTTKGPTVGIGIGLTSTKEIIEKDFRGTLKVESKEDYGSSFKIIIPINHEK